MRVVAASGSGNGAGSTATTGAIDTTGCNLLVAVISHGGNFVGFSDSKGNTWTPLTERIPVAGAPHGRMYWCKPTSVGAGHTAALTADFPSLCFAGFQGEPPASPFDTETGVAVDVGQTVQPGSITPSQAGELLVTGLAHNNFLSGLDSGFTVAVSKDLVDGLSFGSAIAYLQRGSATATNPRWTVTGASSRLAGLMAAFKGFPPTTGAMFSVF